MAKKREKKTAPARPQLGDNVEILSAGEILEAPITETLETNYMPYAMSVIVSRALPEIDGFKPAHRKLLYTMYGMGLLKGPRTKSANIVGSTMHLNPHGDAAIYDTMVRMGRSNESLLVPYVDSKGNFGKAYSRDMAYAAARYTEARLEPVCEELFRDIDKDTVDFVPNYDGTTTEPTLLPVTFPTILANNTLGIAVGMASNICSFNLAELCNATIALMKDPEADLAEILPAPDFVGGGQILYDAAEMENVREHGRGSVRVRAQWRYDKANHCIDVTHIPPTTTVEAVMDKITELVKLGKVREISDMRDETDLNGLKLTIDLKRGQDPEKLMARLFKATPLEDSFACNFNVLIAGQPRVLGVREILLEWAAFRAECVRRRTYHDLQGKQKRLHLLQGLQAILLDIDKAIDIVRNTAEEAEVVPNLMIGFGIDEAQAEYVAEIKLRHLNREYILKRTAEIEELADAIADLEDILKRPARIHRIIMGELGDVAKKYGQPRRCEILYEAPDEDTGEEEQQIPDYPVHLFTQYMTQALAGTDNETFPNAVDHGKVGGPDGAIAGFLRLSLPDAAVWNHAGDHATSDTPKQPAAHMNKTQRLPEETQHPSADVATPFADVSAQLPIAPGEAMIREVHVYGAVAGIHQEGQAAQHRGLGKRLVERACEIARDAGYDRINVISAIGTREYYRKLGFAAAHNGLYQQKAL